MLSSPKISSLKHFILRYSPPPISSSSNFWFHTGFGECAVLVLWRIWKKSPHHSQSRACLITIINIEWITKKRSKIEPSDNTHGKRRAHLAILQFNIWIILSRSVFWHKIFPFHNNYIDLPSSSWKKIWWPIEWLLRANAKVVQAMWTIRKLPLFHHKPHCQLQNEFEQDNSKLYLRISLHASNWMSHVSVIPWQLKWHLKLMQFDIWILESNVGPRSGWDTWKVVVLGEKKKFILQQRPSQLLSHHELVRHQSNNGKKAQNIYWQFMQQKTDLSSCFIFWTWRQQKHVNYTSPELAPSKGTVISTSFPQNGACLAMILESGPIAQNVVESSATYFICLWQKKEKG